MVSRPKFCAVIIARMPKNPLLIPIVVLGVIVIILGVFLARSGSQGSAKSDPVTIGKGLDNVYVQVRINKEVGNSEFTDSIYYSAEEWEKTSKEDVQKSIQARIDNWMKVTNPVPVSEGSASAPASEVPVPAPAAKKIPAPKTLPALPTGQLPAPAGNLQSGS
jgi:hypothetical protein